MPNIPLRAYTREIEGLVEHAQRLDEAIAHCRQILKTYPKHLETYRLLGKAYLEGKRYDQAVDIFERLLVAVPDDFVAHVGMSIIADDQGRLDDAIWHMERAFEVQPSNAAIQGELQRLFGRRDGVEPPKIRLTRGALAHMYVQGQLYTQAISEIRAVLAQDAERADLQVLLAKAYFHGGQKNEAADMCAQLLSRYPYCFDANALMVDLLAGMPSAEPAPEYRQRVNELEPYAAFTQDSVFNTASVPSNAVMLDRLEYAGEAPQAGPLLGSGSELGGMAQISPWSALASREQPAKDLPPFLRPAVSQPLAAGAPGEPPSEAPPGDLPAWVKALAPADDDEIGADSEPNTPEALTWLRSEDTSEGLSSSALAADISESETPAWLKDLGAEIEQPVEEVGSTESEPATSEAQPMPTGEAPSPGSAMQEEEDGLAWLESLAAMHGAAPDETIPPADSSTPEQLSWTEKAAEIGQQAADAWTAIAEDTREQEPAAAEISDKDSGAGGLEIPVAAESTSAESSAEEPASDWLQGLAAQGAFADEADLTPTAATAPPPEGALSDWPRITPPPSVGEQPAWLGGTSSEAGASAPVSAAGPSAPSGSQPDLPDWLSRLHKDKSTPASPPASEGPPPWLQSERQQAFQVPEVTTPADWRPAESVPSTKVAPQAAESTELAGQPASPGAVPTPAATDSGLLPRPVKQSMALLGSAQTEMGRGNIAAALDIYGRLIHKGKSLTEIIRDLRDALNRYPVEIPLWQALGDAYMRSNRLQEALDAYTKAEELLR